MKFYENLYRRHLLDMHIEDWDPVFLSKFSPETYVKNLKTAGINYAMIYFQSHVGLCYFPTKRGNTHRAVVEQPDLMRRTVDLCRENDIRVCGYYSLIYNTREHDKHPDWRLVAPDGRSSRESGSGGDNLDFASLKAARYGRCCPTNPDYRAFTYEQIDEMIDFFDFDALFFDMPFWPYTCYCRHCREDYRNTYGYELPFDPEFGSRQYYDLLTYKFSKMGEFIQSVTDHVKSRKPNMPVEHNFATCVAGSSDYGCGEEVLAACDYVGGDLYGNLYTHSFSSKLFRSTSRNQPFEQMFSRCKPGLRTHTLTKTRDEMLTALGSTMAHHGATLVIDAIDPVGTMDARVYNRLGEIFEFQKPYEPYFTGEMAADVGIYYGMRSRPAGEVINSRSCAANVNQTLIRAHIPFGVTGSFGELDRYKILIAPVLTAAESKDNARLIRYVENGGTLYLSGFGNPALVETLTGHSYKGRTEEYNLYIAPKPEFSALFLDFNEEYPLSFDAAAPIVEPGADCQVLATLTLPYTKPDDLHYAAIHSDPPGVPTDIPAVTVNRFGAGRVVWSALPIENVEFEEYRQIFLNLLHMEEHVFSFVSDAAKHVEITMFRNAADITVNASVLDDEVVSRPVPSFEIRVKTDAAPRKVKLLPDGEEIAFTYSDGYTVFRTRTLKIFDMYQIIL